MANKDLEMKKATVKQDEDVEETTNTESDESSDEDTVDDGDEDSEDEDVEEDKPAPKPLTKAQKLAQKKAQEKAVPNTDSSEMIGDLIEDRRFQLREKARLTRDAIAKQDLVKTMIPRSENEAKDATHFYCINGFAFYVRKGVFQMVPEQVAQMISDTYGQDARVVADNQYNLTNNKAAANEFRR